MAKQLKYITDIITGQPVEASHVSQSVEAFSAESGVQKAYDISVSGSFKVTGSQFIEPNMLLNQQRDYVLAFDNDSGQIFKMSTSSIQDNINEVYRTGSSNTNIIPNKFGTFDNTGTNSAIASGNNNKIDSNCSFIGGGTLNTASASGSFIGGGTLNTVSGNCSFIGGGISNTVSCTNSTIGGGKSNTISAYYGFIGGGTLNQILNGCNFIGGGRSNTTSGYYSSIVGGISNSNSGYCSSIVGGSQNTISSGYGSVGFIGGGFCNTISSDYGFIGGGCKNLVGGTVSSIVGGTLNIASASGSFIGGGSYNQVSGINSSVVGGFNNTASSEFSAIVGGVCNHIQLTHCKSFIVGTNISSSAACTTFVNNLYITGSTTTNAVMNLSTRCTTPNPLTEGAIWNSGSAGAGCLYFSPNGTVICKLAFV
tara:strand:- start:175 stop:1446 length:1272 start_codon:yes stop_codon:yes gene_type:complete